MTAAPRLPDGEPPWHDTASSDDGALRLRVEPLTAAAFAAFGDVIEVGHDAPYRTINAGRARRYDDLARIDTGRADGRPLLSIFRTQGASLPWRLQWVERHRLGSQAFVPMRSARMLVVVAAAGPAPAVEALRCFVGTSGQGVNYAAGTWHHALVVLGDDADVLVVDRGADAADAADCDEHRFASDVWIVD